MAAILKFFKQHLQNHMSYSEQQIKVALLFLGFIFTEKRIEIKKKHRMKTYCKRKNLIMIDHLIVLMTQI